MKIAICGKMCSGKTTIANYIMRTFPGYKKYSFGQKVKDLCVELFNMKEKDRSLLIKFANSMREIDSNVWINQVLKVTKGEDNCIIDDVRYQNEVDALIKDGWSFIQINIPYELQTNRIIKLYPNNYQDHLKNRNHLSEQNSFEFSKNIHVLVLNINNTNEKEIIHNINLFIIRNNK